MRNKIVHSQCNLNVKVLRSRSDDDDDDDDEPLFKCHKILVHYSTNWGH